MENQINLHTGIELVDTHFGKRLETGIESNGLILFRWCRSGLVPVKVLLNHQIYEKTLAKSLNEYPDTVRFAVVPFEAQPKYIATVEPNSFGVKAE